VIALAERLDLHEVAAHGRGPRPARVR
jgi:hypothetical protein